MKSAHLIILNIVLILITSGCIHAAGIEWEYRGKVMDEATGESIAETVVLAVWYTITPTPGGAVSNFYDAEETVTDRNGEFSIPGKGLKKMGGLDMHVWIYKVGYAYFGGPWNAYKEGIAYRTKTKWEDNKLVIPLKKLTVEERKKQLGPPLPPSEAPLSKVILMLKEINKDRIERGLGPITIWKGEKI